MSADPPVEALLSADPPLEALLSADPPVEALLSADPLVEALVSLVAPVEALLSADPPVDALVDVLVSTDPLVSVEPLVDPPVEALVSTEAPAEPLVPARARRRPKPLLGRRAAPARGADVDRSAGRAAGIEQPSARHRARVQGLGDSGQDAAEQPAVASTVRHRSAHRRGAVGRCESKLLPPPNDLPGSCTQTAPRTVRHEA